MAAYYPFTRLRIWLLMGVGLHIVAQEEISQEMPADSDGEDAIPDKIGAEIHLTKSERALLTKLECSMCKNLLQEMHIEVSKHKMISKGVGSESQVIETSNAMCLAMVQKYKLDLVKGKLEKKKEDEDEEMMMSQGADVQNVMRGMLVLKMGCQRWLEDYGGDTSGFVFKAVRDESGSPEDTAKQYCTEHQNLCGAGKKAKKKQEKLNEKKRAKERKELRKKEDIEEEKAKKDNPFESLPEDSKFGLQRMLEMAKDDPFHYMEEADKQLVTKGRTELRCDVCRVMLEDAHAQVMQRPKTMRSEYDILPIVEGLCEGGRDLSVPSYFGVEPPPLPPTWTDGYRQTVDSKTDRYRLKPLTGKGAKRRKEWRALSETGQQKPPQPKEHHGDLMMTLSCKDVLEPARMSEILYEQIKACDSSSDKTCRGAALAAAAAVCKDAEGTTCTFDAQKSSDGDQDSDKAEL